MSTETLSLTNENVEKVLDELRPFLISDGVLKEEGGLLVFQTDYIFKSPSASAAVILARHANGWTEWKNKSGKNIDTLKRKNK